MIVIICLSAFIVADDLFSVLHIGGYTVRLFQLLTAPVLINGLWGLLSRFVWPCGFGKLLIWTVFIIVFIPNTTLVGRSVLYALWLVFNVLLVLALTVSIHTEHALRIVFKWYIYSYAFSAAFGLSQLFLPFVGLEPVLVTQWWFPGILARMNGLTYEPSYYATYMITGWATIKYLRVADFRLPGLRMVDWLVTAALLLCSSRMGWLMMLTWYMGRGLWQLYNRQITWRRVAIIAAIATLLPVLVISVVGLDLGEVAFLTTGLGIIDDPGSTQGRWERAEQTLMVFVQHPIIGVSLGGVDAAIGKRNHAVIKNNDDAKDNQGQWTTAEVLAASGVVGFVFYVLYLTGLFREAFRLPNEPFTVVVKALGWGLLFLIIILQFNQTILRAYLWFHIGLMSAALRLASTALLLSPHRGALAHVCGDASKAALSQ